MKNTIIYLIGFPGTGKLTIAKEICKQAGFKLVDNHLINNPVFSLIHHDGKTKLPEQVWNYARQIRTVVLETAANLSPPDYSFVFTNNLYNEDPEDQDIYDAVEQLAIKRGAALVPIRLTISAEENKKRIVMPDRKTGMKEINPDTPEYNAANFTVLNTGHPNEWTLDVTKLKASQAAKKIIDYARTLSS